MTANQTHNPTLDDVLSQIAAGSRPPDAKSLRAWIAQYPQFAHEITDFATDWVEMEAAHTHVDVTAEDVDLVVNRTMSRVQAMLDAAERPEVIADLTDDIRMAGHDLDSFQLAVGIDRSILDCMIARLIRPATIPGELVRVMAAVLKRSVDQIRDYFRLPPQQSLVYKARKQPMLAQADFRELVEHAKLSDKAKAHWLARAPDPALQDPSSAATS